MFEMGASTIRLFLFWGGRLFFLILELFRSYRALTVPKVNRWVNNLALTFINSIILQVLFSSAHHALHETYPITGRDRADPIPDVESISPNSIFKKIQRKVNVWNKKPNW